MAVPVVVVLLVWLTIGLAVSIGMAARGYDRTAWLVVGLLFGPVAVLFSILTLVVRSPRRPQRVADGVAGSGHHDLLVVCFGDRPAAARRVLAVRGKNVHRLVVARVLPFDGAKQDERDAVVRLRRLAAYLDVPEAELTLLFGVPAQAVAAFAFAGGFQMIVTDRAVPGLKEKLATTNVSLIVADEKVIPDHLPPADNATEPVLPAPADTAAVASEPGITAR